MSQLRRLVWNILYFFWDVRQRFKFGRVHCSELYIFDIDNTLTVSKLGKQIDHHSPLPRSIMIRFVNQLLSEDKAVLFLSARDFRLYQTTKAWLVKHEIWDKSKGLLLVKSAKAKLPYLTNAIRQNGKVIFIDDMSYNHENGSVKMHDSLIKSVSKLDLIYFGREVIENNRISNFATKT